VEVEARGISQAFNAPDSMLTALGNHELKANPLAGLEGCDFIRVAAEVHAHGIHVTGNIFVMDANRLPIVLQFHDLSPYRVLRNRFTGGRLPSVIVTVGAASARGQKCRYCQEDQRAKGLHVFGEKSRDSGTRTYQQGCSRRRKHDLF
jgi:hypothetical protein